MKKTLIVLSTALMGAAFSAQASTTTTITATPSIPDGAWSSGVAVYGFTFDFTDATFSVGDTSIYSTFSLESVAIYAGTSASYTNVKLAMFKVTNLNNSSSLTDWTLSFEGLASGSESGSKATYTFENAINLDTTATYAFILTRNGSTAADQYDEDDLKNITSVSSLSDKTWNKYFTVIANDAECASSTNVSGNSNGLNGNNFAITSFDGNGYQADKTLRAEYTINAHAVPEPTTATLSLLALAGLAARRRRK